MWHCCIMAESRLIFQDFPKLGRQTLALIGPLLLHVDRVGNCLFDSFHLLLHFDLLNVLPKSCEIPDRLHIGRSGWSFRDQFIHHIENTAELLSVTV
jgi:hypothetical protein